MISSAFEYHAPTTVEQAVTLLDEHKENARILAGGHSLIPLMRFRLAEPEILIDLGKINDLTYIREEEDDLTIGAMTVYRQIANSGLVNRRAAALSEAAGQVADPQVRNMGTIGGSLAHADPAADLPAVMLALGARMEASSHGAIRGVSRRMIDADDFFVDLLTTALEPDEILTEIRIPKFEPGTGTSYVKFANKASHFAVVGVSVLLTMRSNGVCQNARIGVTGAGPKAVRAREAEEILIGNELEDATIESAARMADYGIEFNEDVHASAEYREHLTEVFAERGIRAALSRVR
jgi:carbon-monoxide dehydrogenase medium subunit